MSRSIRKVDGVYTCMMCGQAVSNQIKPYAGACNCGKLAATPKKPGFGPGTELKKLLSRLGIRAMENCSCAARASLMDARGSEWCESNIDDIVGWLREEAAKRGLPFVDAAGRMLVRRAIRNARRSTS